MPGVEGKVEQARLVVSRMAEKDLKMRGIEVLLDGEFLGDLQYGHSLEREIAPGKHTLKVTNRLSSKTSEFDVAPGQTVNFEATGLLMGGLWIGISMLGTIAYRVALDRKA